MIRCAIPLVLLCTAAFVRGETPSEGDAALGQLAWMVGGKWVAETKTPDGGPLKVEMNVDWAAHHKALKYAIILTAGGKSNTRYDGTYYWHPGKKQLALLQIDLAGNVTESTAAWDGDVLKQFNVVTQTDGSQHEQRVETKHTGADTFEFRGRVKKGSEWVEAISLKYTRAK